MLQLIIARMRSGSCQLERVQPVWPATAHLFSTLHVAYHSKTTPL